MILGAVTVAITFAISIIIIWNVVASIDSSGTDANLRRGMGGVDGGSGATTDEINATWQRWNDTQYVTNSTDDITTNIETFYTVAPIVLIVMAAVGILGYVLLLRR